MAAWLAINTNSWRLMAMAALAALAAAIEARPGRFKRHSLSLLSLCMRTFHISCMSGVKLCAFDGVMPMTVL